jgi:hypothetical protein
MRRIAEYEGGKPAMSRDNKQLFLALFASALLLAPAYSLGQSQQQQPAAQTEQQEEYTEEEYDAYEKATKEADLDKRADMLIAFMEKYPKSKLMSYIDQSYQELMYKYNQGQKWDKLLPLAERWLKTHPDDLQAIDYAAAAAQNLGQHQKFIDYGLKVFAAKPTKEYIYFIAQSYKKMGDEAKYQEWTEKSFPYFPDDFVIRMEFVHKYIKENNVPKAAEYAQQALKAMELAKKPDTMSDADWQKLVRDQKKTARYIIGVNLYTKDRYPEAIKALEAILTTDKKFGPAYYYIGYSQWQLGQIDEAIENFCKAAILKSEMQTQAKEHMEKLYKSIHNDTLIGIDKVWRRNEKELGVERAAN